MWEEALEEMGWIRAVTFALLAIGLFKLFMRWLRKDRELQVEAPTAEEFNVVIVGAGFGGLGLGIKLKNAGIPFVIVEKAPEVGGTWYWNRYYGCACDIPSHLYSYSFEPKHDWSRVYPTQPEILEYLKHCARKYGIYPHLRLSEEAEEAHFDSSTHKWTVRTKSGKSFVGNVMVSAFGGLHVPNYPDIPGFEEFQGLRFHTAEWSRQFEPTEKHKKVAIIGSAASAVQVIPRMAEVAEEVVVFQRTPNWISPRLDSAFGFLSIFLLKWLPGAREALRWFYYLRQELVYEIVFKRFLASSGRGTQALLEKFINVSVGDKMAANGEEKLADVLTPNFPPGCKRILISSEYYKALASDNVTVVTDPIASVSEGGVVVQNKRTGEYEEYEADAILCATGFQMLKGFPTMLGKSKRDLMTEYWRDLPEAYLGITSEEFPNMFVMLGPNTGLGHNSVIYMLECQMTYIVGCVMDMIEEGIKEVSVKEEKNREFQTEIQAKLRESVWSRSYCTSWYQNAKGVIFALWPGPTFTYWLRTRNTNLHEDYDIIY